MSAATGATPALLHAGAVVAALVHLGWSGAIAGTATVAAALDALGGPRYRRLAAAVAGASRPGLLAVAWLEVTGTALLVAERAAHPGLAQSAAFWAGVLAPLVAGVALAGLHRSLLEDGRAGGLRTVAGLAGIGALLTSDFVLCSGAGALLQPEAWPTREPWFRFLPTWSGTGRFAELTFLSLALTGGLVMHLGNRPDAGAEARFARRFGARLALACLAALPLAVLFTHANLPAIALSPGVWGAAGAGLGLAGAVAWAVSGHLDGDAPVRPGTLLGAGIALFALLAAGDHLARENAQRPEVLAGLVAAPSPAAKGAAKPEADARLAAGKAVFDRVCSVCHRFDARKIGPAFDGVVPKYRKDPAALKAFIRNPVKKNPAFPAMPKPAVTDAEIDAVAAYVLEKAAP